MNASRNDGFPVGGTSNHATHVGQPESPVTPPALADIVDGHAPSWESAWIDLGGEG